MIRGLSLWQPWASLIAIGAKLYETRSWSTPYRGELAIHATKVFPAEARELCGQAPFFGALQAAKERPFDPLPRGAIVAVAEIIACYPTEGIALTQWWDAKTAHREIAFGDYSEGRWAWVLKNIRRLSRSVPCRGAQGLWIVPADVERQIREQFGEVLRCDEPSRV